jgi:hypothetical protein
VNLEDLNVRPDGAAILDELRNAIARFVVLPSPAAADAVTLWIAATHAQPCWEHASRLVIKSPIKRCGKTRLQEVIAETSHRELRTANISPAALVRSIDPDDPPTLLIDEADAIFAKRRGERSESAETIRGILNAGYGRGVPYIRWDAAARRLEECPTFAMACIAAIGDLPDTIEDRGPVIVLQRRGPGENVEPFRRRSIPPLHALRERLAGWVASVADALAQAEPALPVEDRAADVWEPLVAIADAAGGHWPELARRACASLTAATADPDEASAGERLLADLYDAFDDCERMTTTDVLEALRNLEESPWGDWYGHALTARELARLLRPYGVKPRVIRVGAATPRGYERRDLEDAFRRYVRNTRNSATAGPEQEASKPDAAVADALPVIRNTSATAGFLFENGHKSAPVAGVAGVADGVPTNGHRPGAFEGTCCVECGAEDFSYDSVGVALCRDHAWLAALQEGDA